MAKANARRREIADIYRAGLAGLPGLILPQEKKGFHHVFHQFAVRVLNGKRDALLGHLSSRGIGCAVHYPVPIHQQPAYRNVPLTVPLTVTEEINPQLLSLPMFPELTAEEQTCVISVIRDFYR